MSPISANDSSANVELLVFVGDAGMGKTYLHRHSFADYRLFADDNVNELRWEDITQNTVVHVHNATQVPVQLRDHVTGWYCFRNGTTCSGAPHTINTSRFTCGQYAYVH